MPVGLLVSLNFLQLAGPFLLLMKMFKSFTNLDWYPDVSTHHTCSLSYSWLITLSFWCALVQFFLWGPNIIKFSLFRFFFIRHTPCHSEGVLYNCPRDLWYIFCFKPGAEFYLYTTSWNNITLVDFQSPTYTNLLILAEWIEGNNRHCIFHLIDLILECSKIIISEVKVQAICEVLWSSGSHLWF